MMDKATLTDMALRTLYAVEQDDAVFASSSSGSYAAIFGRDSLISALLLLNAAAKGAGPYPLQVARKAIRSLYALQGSALNIESGEEPGKIIHEFRRAGHHGEGWCQYPDGSLRSYDSLDATPLFLIAIDRYASISGDEAFLEEAMPHACRALDWLLEYGDKNGDGFIDYGFHPERTLSGPPSVQNWMDSSHSLFHENGSPVLHPVAPVEVQGYVFAAFSAWAKRFERSDPGLATLLTRKAAELKAKFNSTFVLGEAHHMYIAAGIDGAGKPLESLRSSAGHLLFAVYEEDGRPLSILEDRHVPLLVKRLLSPDMFEAKAGIRTLSSLSAMFDAIDRYHNGTIWPHDCEMVAIGYEHFGYIAEAAQIREALLSAYRHFQSPIELFTYLNGEYGEYAEKPPVGSHKGCLEQTWSAAALLSLIFSHSPESEEDDANAAKPAPDLALAR